MNRNVEVWFAPGDPPVAGKIVGTPRRAVYVPATEKHGEYMQKLPETWFQGGFYVLPETGFTTFVARATHGKSWRFR